MKIVKLELKNFKRFDDLTIDLTSLAEPPKLVLLIGTNGSGKSSVFDGFEILNDNISGRDSLPIALPYNFKSDVEDNYHNKGSDKDFFVKAEVLLIDKNNNEVFLKIDSVEKTDIVSLRSFYGRTSFRQVPKLTRTRSGTVSSLMFEQDSDRPRTFIDRDDRFENDIEKISSAILIDVFKNNESNEAIKENYINPINRAFENIFGTGESTNLKLLSIIPPLDTKTADISFEKGKSRIPYNLLSSGEKEIFNILLNLLSRRDYFKNTVYFFDEIDLHLNTLLQKKLLKEIVENWIPENCQLWTASHSLGFIEYANEAEHAAIIDLDNLNFDLPQLITPSPKSNFDVFEIAVSKEFLSTIFEGKKLMFSENTDTTLYNNLKLKDTLFLVAKDKVDVFYKAKNNDKYNGLIDRDYLTDEERDAVLAGYRNLHILNYYSVENYLYHPDNLSEYNAIRQLPFDKQEYVQAITATKQTIRIDIAIGLLKARESYSFFKEDKPKIVKRSEKLIIQMFDSDDFETFYKVFPAKDYGTTIKQRQNINPIELAKTSWFKKKIEQVVKK